MPSPGSGGTLGELLASRRQRRFVGRAAEVELVRSALDLTEPSFLMLHIYGPPGVGKTSLLDVCADLATNAGAHVVRLDGRDLLPSPLAVQQRWEKFSRCPMGKVPSVSLPATAEW